MLDISFQEVGLIFLVALVILGPRRLPELARLMGRLMRQFRQASDELKRNLFVDEVDDLRRDVHDTIRATTNPLSYRPTPRKRKLTTPPPAEAEVTREVEMEVQAEVDTQAEEEADSSTEENNKPETEDAAPPEEGPKPDKGPSGDPYLD